MSTRTITHLAVSPAATGGHPPSGAELLSILETYMSAERDPNGGVISTSDGVKITQLEVEDQSERALLEKHIISLAVFCFSETKVPGMPYPDHLLSAVMALGRTVKSYLETGNSPPHSIEVTKDS